MTLAIAQFCIELVKLESIGQLEVVYAADFEFIPNDLSSAVREGSSQAHKICFSM